jgi:hypothetical protein
MIHSTEYEGFKLQEKFKETTEYINRKFSKKLVSPLTITLGDEFQGIAKSLKNSILIIISLEEHILKNNAFLHFVM